IILKFFQISDTKTMSLLELEWWVYLIIVLAFFVVCLGLNYVVKKINETKIDERFIRMLHKASTAQSTQVSGPLIVMETTRGAQNNIKTPQPSPQGISLVFNQEDNKRKKDLEDTMIIIKNSMLQKKFDALSLNTNASLEQIDIIPLIRSTRTVNDAISLKMNEAARTEETHGTKINLNVTERVLVKRNDTALGTTKEPSVSNESDCYKTDLVSVEKNEYGHVITRPTTSINQCDSKIRDLFYMEDDSRIADTGTKLPFVSNGNLVKDETFSVRTRQNDKLNTDETNLLRQSFNENQSTSHKESDHKNSRNSLPNIFNKHSNYKNVDEDSGLTKVVHNIVSKLSSLSKHSNIDSRDNTFERKTKKFNLDRETSANTQVETQPEKRNVPIGLSSMARTDRCLTKVISMKQNELNPFLTKANSNAQSDHNKTDLKSDSSRTCKSAEESCSLKYKNILTGTTNFKEAFNTPMKIKDSTNKPNIKLLNTHETEPLRKSPHSLQIDSHFDAETNIKIKTVEENQPSSIEKRCNAQTNLIISHRNKPNRETSSSGIISDLKVETKAIKQSKFDEITPQKLQTIEKNTTNNNTFYIPSKIATDDFNTIKSGFESKIENAIMRPPAYQNTSPQSGHCDTEESWEIQSKRQVTEPRVFMGIDSKLTLSKDSSLNRNCKDETVHSSCTPNIKESNSIKNKLSTAESYTKEDEI
ncbi:hypothetical protein HW555_003141, partial [Spodoptera exigua]